MNFSTKPFLLVCFSLLLAGCVAPQVTSVVDKDNIYKINEISILIDGPHESTEKSLGKNLVAQLTSVGVRSNYIITSFSKSNALVLNEKNDSNILATRISEAKSDAVLICGVQNIEMINGQISKIEIVFSIYSKKLNKVLWKSQVTTSGGFTRPFLISSIATDTVAKIKSDGLI